MLCGCKFAQRNDGVKSLEASRRVVEEAEKQQRSPHEEDLHRWRNVWNKERTGGKFRRMFFRMSVMVDWDELIRPEREIYDPAGRSERERERTLESSVNSVSHPALRALCGSSRLSSLSLFPVHDLVKWLFLEMTSYTVAGGKWETEKDKGG